MTLDQVPTGAHVFVDSNIFAYHFQPHPGFGPMCQRLLERIERQDIEGYTSTNLLGELAHRLMVIEAGALPGWAGSKVLNRLKQQPGIVKQLSLFQTAIDSVLRSKLRVLTVPASLASTAAALSRQYGLLTNDAFIFALRRHNRRRTPRPQEKLPKLRVNVLIATADQEIDVLNDLHDRAG